MDNFNKRDALILSGLTILFAGFTTGWFARRFLVENQTINADDILDDVKEQFLQEGPIEGSWIELNSTPVQKEALHTDAYYGGISRYEKSELVQYEFIADAYTGSILDIYKL
ncbi:MAG: PepSY domain-containing protein [Atopococcus tabaci]|uniref:PepSY domain-containing protein n=1 Tax=Atopococcus tabaci TaxID=269774 RepID=A0AA43ZRN4_9LACT|nr:PepSY domain-containing protein [Atopococcus tabaci]